MLKKVIKFTDFNDEEVEETHFFHLSKADLVRMEVSQKAGWEVAMRRIIEAEDREALVREFEIIILGSYGQKSPDGRHFVKNEQLREEFRSSLAYEALFMEFMTDTDAAIAFCNGILPQDLLEESKDLLEEVPKEEAPPGKLSPS